MSVDASSNGSATEPVIQPIALEDIAAKLDALGTQMDWVVENLASLFQFVAQVSSNGGGIRGLMQLLKSGPPQQTGLTSIEGGKDSA